MMVVKSEARFLFVYIFLIPGYLFRDPRIIDNPKILPPYDDVIQPNNNYTVFCQGIAPLNWTTPEVSGDKQNWTRFIIEPETPNDERYQYGSKLSIINMTYPFSGFYYCHHENVNKSDKYSSNIQLLVTPSPTTRRPQILSEYEIVIQPNSSYSIFCQGTKPLTWSTPELDESRLREYFTTFATKSERPLSDEYEYGSRLYIVNMTYPFWGFYYCHHEDANKLSEFESSSVYLYVNDTNNLCNLSPYKVNYIKFNGEPIPCRPTSPDVHVSLHYIDSFPVEDFIYDPKIGFTGIPLQWSNFNNRFFGFNCSFARNSKDQINVTVTTDVLNRIPPPLIHLQDRSDGHTIVGESLILTCFIHCEDIVKFTWTTPYGPVDLLSERMKITRLLTAHSDTSEKMYHQTLVVYNATLDDRGTYSCNVSEMGRGGASFVKHLNVNIFSVDEYFINISTINNSSSKITAVNGQPYAQFEAIVQGHPKPTVTWQRPPHNLIGERYEKSFDTQNNVALLKIKNVRHTDFGPFVIKASNNKTEEIFEFWLDVRDNPTVEINQKSLTISVNSSITMNCTEYAYPLVKLEWQYKLCQTENCSFLPLEGTVLKNESTELVSEVTFRASESGTINCFARSFRRNIYNSVNFYVSDVKHGFDVFGLDSTIDLDQEKMVATVAHQEPIAVTCGASLQFFSDIVWLFKGQTLQNGDRYKLTRNNTQYSNILRLEIPRANYSDSGLYTCEAMHRRDIYIYGWSLYYDFENMYGNKEVYKDEKYKYLFKNISFNVIDLQPPKILFTNLKAMREINLPDKLEIICNASGFPNPTVTWYKDEMLFRPSEPNRIQVHDDNERIVFLSTEVKDEGTYKCEARNKAGVKYREQSVRFKNIPRNPEWMIYVIIFVMLLLVVAVLIVVLKIRKEKEFQRKLKELGLANFIKGGVKHINPELSIEDQAELLPYDQKWEFPIYNLKLGKQLGSGEFGTVMVGQAKNILKEEKLTTVAVKMVKKSADPKCIKALASELKIMIYLGKHLNVVNLLGACTKNIVRSELLVIVEYCHFGNLQNYLLTHRDNFIDQVNPETGKIEYTIDQEQFNLISATSDRSQVLCSLVVLALDVRNKRMKYIKLNEKPKTISQISKSIMRLSVNELGMTETVLTYVFDNCIRLQAAFDNTTIGQ